MRALSRRDFCALTAGAVCSGNLLGQIPHLGAPPQLPQRTPVLPKIELGRTGVSLPRLGMGCGAIGNLEDDREAVEIVLKAISLGVRYFDTSPGYGDGRSERRLGAAIAECGIDRSKFFIATKADRKDRAGALEQLDVSLRRLQMDYVDAWQVHSLTFDPEPLFQPGTVIEAMERAREAGRVHFLGITSHEMPPNMIKAIELYPFDLVLIGLNLVHTEYMETFVPRAMQKDIGIVVMKPYNHGHLFPEHTAAELLQFVLRQPGVHIVVPGLDAKWQVDQAFLGVAE